MKIRAQIGMVLNLDKCIGCHTCSVTCKNVWTSRPGVEYAWFNNVETKPGIGYPKEWENQDKWNGGWVRNPDGSIAPRQGGKWKLLMRIFANPNLPQIDDYYRALHVRLRPPSVGAREQGCAHGPSAQPDHRQAHGEDRMGPELGRNPGRRVQQAQQGQELRRCAKDIYGQFENTFMMYLPRLCRALSEPGVRGIVPQRLDLQARGRRHRADRPGTSAVAGACASRAAPTRRSTTTGSRAKPRSASSATRASKSASPRCAPETCVGRIRYLGVLLYDADRIQEAASVERDRDLYQGAARHLPGTRTTPM